MSYKSFTFGFLGIALGAFMTGALQFVVAWTAPSTPPPPDPSSVNVSAPVNVSATPQYKIGPMSINSALVPPAGYEFGVGGDAAISGVLTTTGDIMAGGSVSVGTTEASCAPTNAGSIRWTGTSFEGCDGSGTWKPFGGVGGGSGVACAAENTFIKLDGTYTVPAGITHLVFELRGAGGGSGGSGTGAYGSSPGYADSSAGGNGGNTCLFRGATLVKKANGGAGSGSGSGTGIMGGQGALNIELVEVTPGETLNIKVGGGGGGGGFNAYSPLTPAGGAGEYTGAVCQNNAQSGGYMASGGAGTKKTGGGGNGASYPSSVPTSISSGSGSGGSPSVSFVSFFEYGGAGCESASCSIPGMQPTNGNGGQGGSILVRTPTASELTAAGLSTYCN